MAGGSPVSVVGIAGITGKLGQLAAEAILSTTSDVKIQGFCRDKSKVAPSLSDHARVSIIEGQSDDMEAARKAVRGCQVVICAYLVRLVPSSTPFPITPKPPASPSLSTPT